MIMLPKNEGLNIVPFIDIMLVLLAIVLSVATFVAQGEIKVNLPTASAAAPISQNEEKLTILIDENSAFYIDDIVADKEALKAKIAAISPRVLVELKSDKNARFEAFVEVINLLKEKSHEKFKIITEKSL